MKRVDSDFKERVYALVASIPKGRIMTYGQIAAQCGHPEAAWEVGQIAHWGPDYLPWQRVVNKQGGLARSYTKGGLNGHKAQLEKDGIYVSGDYKVNIEKLTWYPDEQST